MLTVREIWPCPGAAICWIAYGVATAALDIAKLAVTAVGQQIFTLKITASHELHIGAIVNEILLATENALAIAKSLLKWTSDQFGNASYVAFFFFFYQLLYFQERVAYSVEFYFEPTTWLTRKFSHYKQPKIFYSHWRKFPQSWQCFLGVSLNKKYFIKNSAQTL